MTGSYANSFSNDELSKSNLSIEYFSDQINDLENLVVEVTMNIDEFSISGTIGIQVENLAGEDYPCRWRFCRHRDGRRVSCTAWSYGECLDEIVIKSKRK